MILSDRKAQPIIQKLLENASEIITEKTGVKYDWVDISLELFDCEWIFSVNIDNDKNYIDINQVVRVLDNIITRYDRFAKQEREENENVNF